MGLNINKGKILYQTGHGFISNYFSIKVLRKTNLASRDFDEGCKIREISIIVILRSVSSPLYSGKLSQFDEYPTKTTPGPRILIDFNFLS